MKKTYRNECEWIVTTNKNLIQDGYNAYIAGISPDRCPYLIENYWNTQISPSWYDGKGKVIGTKYDKKIKKVCGINDV